VQKHNAALLIPALLGIVESIALPQYGDHELSYKTAALRQPGQIPGALRSEMFLTSFCDSIDDLTMTDWTLEVSHVIQEQDNLCVRTCL